MDIDKIYAIMASLNRNGIYDEYENGNLNIVNFNNSPVVDISTISDIELELYENLLELVNYVNDKNYNSILLAFTDKVKSLLIENDITLDKNILYSLLLSKSFITNKSIVDKIFKDIHFELLAKTGLEQSRKNKSSGLQNYILESIISLYRDPRTLVAANNPTTMNPIHEAVDSVGAGKELRSHWDAFTDIYVNQTTAVGKKDIGISAVAQKAFYALTFYDEVRKSQGRSVFNPLMIEVPSSWGGNIYSYGFPDTKIDENSINILLSEMFNNPLDWTEYNTYTDTIPNVRHFVHKSGANVFVKTEQYDDYTKYLLYVGKDWESAKQIKAGDYFGEFSVTTLNSAIISSSTDNAKEMMMDLLNATPEILPAYEYLLSIGCDIRQAAKILTDPIIKAIITVTRGNLFLGDKGFSKSSKVFSKKGKERVQEIMQRRSDYDNAAFEAKWTCLNKIFDGAAELTMLGQALGINQGVKVEFGEPLLYQLQFERRLRDKKIFLNLEMFLADYQPNEEIVLIPGSYAERKIAEYEKVKERINLLDLIYSVPHFHSMFTVPIQFRNAVQLLSKDIDNVYTIAYKQGISTYWDQSSLRQLLKAVNDRKIADFFIKYPFVYQAETKLIWHNNRIEERPMEDKPWELSTATSEGLLTLKEYIETNVIPWIRKMYPTNEFVTNLIPSSRFNDLFGIRTSFYGSRINLSDPQYEDQMFIIKTAFDKISKEEFNGHTILEWMFVYDLLVNKHAIGKNSITMLFENGVDLTSDNIISKWESFITEYDQSYGKYPTNSRSFNSLPIHKSDNEDEHDDAIWANIPSSNIPSWAPDPDYLPLYIEGNKITTDILVDRSTLYEAFRRGFLRANKC